VSEQEYGPYAGQDKVKWLVVILSPWTKTVYAQWDALEWNTSKDDSGDAGQFSVTFPYIHQYYSTGQPSPLVQDYASIMGPMDLVAIFAYRTRDDNPDLVPIGPLGSTYNGPNIDLAYADITSIGKLGSATCVMIGMVDQAVEVTAQMSDNPSTHITITGRDLTKIFYDNDANVPAVSVAAESGIFNLPLTWALTSGASGTTLLIKLLDLICGKDPGAAVDFSTSPVSAATEASFQQFAFKWRNFVRTDALEPGFINLLPAKLPPFHVQTGSTWANIMEIRNAPAYRLFVNEIGQLIFDDALEAWTTQDGTGQLAASDIHEFEVSISDADLCTYLVVYPFGALATQTSIVTMKGYDASLGFAGGIAGDLASASLATNPQAAISVYGYRYAEFAAFYAVTIDEAKKQFAALQQYHNSLYRATLVVRGTTAWRVGQRIFVPVRTAKAATTNQLWYIERIEHSASFGEDWKTTMHLRFPGGQ
jgi:hypothetical protein